MSCLICFNRSISIDINLLKEEIYKTNKDTNQEKCQFKSNSSALANWE